MNNVASEVSVPRPEQVTDGQATEPRPAPGTGLAVNAQIERRLVRPDPSRKRKLASLLVVVILIAAGLSALALLPRRGSGPTPQVTIQDMSAIRDLDVLGEVPYRYMSEDELSDTLARTLDPVDLEETGLAFNALFLMDYSEDLESLYLDAYSSQVMGFYDFDAKEMVLVEHGASDTMERVTLSHELTHALQDQHFNLTALLDVDTADQALARQSLVEGDAMAAMAFYLLSLPRDETQAFLEEMEALSTASADIPYAIEQTMIFPYLQGAEFVLDLYLDGGWNAVNAAYARPPRSTEQVMHPEKYSIDEQPLDVDLDLNPGGLELAFEDTLGEYMTSVMLAHYIGNETAGSAAEGWGGDIFGYYGNGTHFLSVLKTIWDTEQDAAEFQDAFQEFMGSLPEKYDPLIDTGCLTVTRQGSTTTVYHASHPSYMSGLSA